MRPALFLQGVRRTNTTTPEEKNPSLKMTLVETQDNSVTFSIAFEDADQLAYMISEEAITDPSSISARAMCSRR